MEVKGEAILSLPIFIIKKFGVDKYKNWLSSLSPRAREIYSNPINKNEWYPLKESMIEPTWLMCDTFYNGSLRGAWDCGRYSAEYGLKGIYRVLVKLRSPQVLIRKGGGIMSSYYKSSEMEVAEQSREHALIRILYFPGIDKVVEYRIAGWIERAIEVTGCKHVSVNITRALSNHDRYTEYRIYWKRSF